MHSRDLEALQQVDATTGEKAQIYAAVTTAKYKAKMTGVGLFVPETLGSSYFGYGSGQDNALSGCLKTGELQQCNGYAVCYRICATTSIYNFRCRFGISCRFRSLVVHSNYRRPCARLARSPYIRRYGEHTTAEHYYQKSPVCVVKRTQERYPRTDSAPS